MGSPTSAFRGAKLQISPPTPKIYNYFTPDEAYANDTVAISAYASHYSKSVCIVQYRYAKRFRIFAPVIVVLFYFSLFFFFFLLLRMRAQ